MDVFVVFRWNDKLKDVLFVHFYAQGEGKEDNIEPHVRRKEILIYVLRNL